MKEQYLQEFKNHLNDEVLSSERTPRNTMDSEEQRERPASLHLQNVDLTIKDVCSLFFFAFSHKKV
jgi:hypothetical protein